MNEDAQLEFNLVTAEATDYQQINTLYDEVEFTHSNPSSDTVILAKNKSEIIGLGRLVAIDNCTAELGGFYVKDEYRGYGIAKAIVSELLKYADNYRRIYCLPFENLKNFYMQYGFVEIQDEGVHPMIKDKHIWCNSTYQSHVLLLAKFT